MEKKKKNKTYLLISLGVLAAIVITLGITYAYWRLTREQTNENVITTACLDVDIESQQDDINLPKAYPISDTDADSLVPFKFTIHNKCEDNASYQINLESMNREEILETQRLNPKYLKFKLNEVNQNGITRLLTGSKEEDTTSVTPTITNAYDAHKLMSGYIEPSGSKSFEFRIWMDSETTAEETESMNKTFISKISVTSTYLEEGKIPPTAELAISVCEKDITASITGEANGEKSITKYEYKIDSNEWQDGSEVNELTNQSEGKHTIKARVTDNKGIVSEEVEQEVNIGQPEMVEIAGMQVPIATCKNGLYKVEHNDLSELGSEWNKTEYRYAGVNYTDGETPYVHNYVEFNNEKWRIIGLVNVKVVDSVEQRVKIIRTNGISEQKDFGNYAWDRDSSSSYTNKWTTSTLKDMLNGIYYESSNGECYTGSNGSTVSQSECDFSGSGELPKGLDEEARQMIDGEVIWNIGGWDTSDITADKFYEKERGTSTGSRNGVTYPAEWTKENDVEYHKGIGLIYPSDYGYAVGGEKRNECLSDTLFHYNLNNCYKNDWLKESSGYQWLLSPNSSNSSRVFCVDSGGYVNIGYCGDGNALGVVPVGYLLPSVTIYNGDGSFDNPFRLSVQ